MEDNEDSLESRKSMASMLKLLAHEFAEASAAESEGEVFGEPPELLALRYDRVVSAMKALFNGIDDAFGLEHMLNCEPGGDTAKLWENGTLGRSSEHAVRVRDVLPNEVHECKTRQ